MRYFVLYLLAFVAAAAQPANNGKAPTPQKKAQSAASASTPQGLTVDGVLTMAKAGLSDDLIVARLRKEDKGFDLTPDELVRLKKANVSDNVIKVMLDPKADISSPAVAPAPTAAKAPPSATPVALAAPVVAVPGPIPSGPTPSLGTTSSGDPNDPAAPHDSGVYLYTQDREGKPLMAVLERAAYQGTKMGTAKCGLTGGLMKCKEKAVIPGSRASLRTNDQVPVFYFYFEDKAAGLGKGLFSANISSPNQFALIKLEVNKSNRETTIAKVGAFGSDLGTDPKAVVGFKSERIRSGLYRVTPSTEMPAGEYCFLASLGNVGAFGAGAAGAVDIFDFGVQ